MPWSRRTKWSLTETKLVADPEVEEETELVAKLETVVELELVAEPVVEPTLKINVSPGKA